MYLIIFETPSFDFIATGENHIKAFAALEAGWQRHAEQTGADPDYLANNSDSVRMIGEVTPGECLRDGSVI